jgi:hypothetical protein
MPAWFRAIWWGAEGALFGAIFGIVREADTIGRLQAQHYCSNFNHCAAMVGVEAHAWLGFLQGLMWGTVAAWFQWAHLREPRMWP